MNFPADISILFTTDLNSNVSNGTTIGENDIPFWGRKSLAAACLTDDSFVSIKTLDFWICFPFYTLIVLICLNCSFVDNFISNPLRLLHVQLSKKHVTNINSVTVLLFGVQISHAFAHLYDIPYCDEWIIFLYVIYNYQLNYIVLHSIRCRPLLSFFENTIGLTGFYILYFGSVLILLSVFYYGGYLCASFCQCMSQWIVTIIWDNFNYPKRDDWKIRKTLYCWNIWFTISYTVMAIEILHCDWLLNDVFHVPWHIIVDFLFEITNYYQVQFFLLENNPYFIQFDDTVSINTGKIKKGL